jgi:arabinoxylan arabinofuranohydrolase
MVYWNFGKVIKAGRMGIMKCIFRTLCTILFFTFDCIAQNPICPPGVYIADPSAHVWGDGRLFIYGSTDESCDYYCSWHHDVMVTSDLVKWNIAGNVFSSRGGDDKVPYNNSLLFAPDCAFRDGTYYLYYCQPDRQFAGGAAASDSPTGPFGQGIPISLGVYNQIDPSVFIDEDGTAYYLWGQFSLKMGVLKSSMTELDSASIRDNVITEADHFFHEGAFLAKRKGVYYLVYADISREDKPTCIGYATSTSPFGPYAYGGVIIDNNGCNPSNWNNHGSIAEYNGQWYVFYHRSTHGCKIMRKACVEKIRFLPDGSIPEVEMTSHGAGGPLPAGQKIDAARACLLHGNVRITAVSDTNEVLTGFRDGDAVVYKYLDFGEGVRSITLRIKSDAGGRLVISTDKPWHNRMAVAGIEAGTLKNDWQTLTFEVESIHGVHALWFQGYGDEGDLFEIDWFAFNPI